MAVTKIVVARSVAGLLDRAEEVEHEETLNEDATVERWTALLRAELTERFPGAAVEIRTQRSEAAGLQVEVRADDEAEARAAHEAVTAIGERLASGEDWVVPEVGG